jgi:hypothetical protein
MGNKRNARKPSTAKTTLVSAAEPSRPKRASKPTYKVAQQAEETTSSEEDSVDQEDLEQDIVSKLKEADLDLDLDLDSDIVEEDWKLGWDIGESEGEVVEIRKDVGKKKKVTSKQ